MLTWQEKLLQLEKENIKNFVHHCDCGCEQKCVTKIAKLGQEGLDMVHDLREARFSGTSGQKEREVSTTVRQIFYPRVLTPRGEILARENF